MRRLLSLCILLLLAACAKPQKPIWTDLPSADQLLERVAATTGQVASLDTAASVGVTVKGKYLSSQQFLLAEKPDRLRADVLTGFGQLALQLASDGEELSVFLNTTVPGRFFRGAASHDNLARFTRVPLSAQSLIRLLLYDPPLIAYRQASVVEGKGGLVLKLGADEREQELYFDTQLRLVGCRYLGGGSEQLEVLYQKIAEEDGFPRQIRISLPAEETKLVLKLSELQTNVSIAEERFRLQQPKNTVVEPLP